MNKNKFLSGILMSVILMSPVAYATPSSGAVKDLPDAEKQKIISMFSKNDFSQDFSNNTETIFQSQCKNTNILNGKEKLFANLNLKFKSGLKYDKDTDAAKINLAFINSFDGEEYVASNYIFQCQNVSDLEKMNVYIDSNNLKGILNNNQNNFFKLSVKDLLCTLLNQNDFKALSSKINESTKNYTTLINNLFIQNMTYEKDGNKTTLKITLDSNNDLAKLLDKKLSLKSVNIILDYQNENLTNENINLTLIQNISKDTKVKSYENKEVPSGYKTVKKNGKSQQEIIYSKKIIPVYTTVTNSTDIEYKINVKSETQYQDVTLKSISENSADDLLKLFDDLNKTFYDNED